MKRAFKTYLIGVAAIVLLAVVMGLILPGQWDAKAVVQIKAPSASVHEYVADFRKWDQWATTALATEDPNAEIVISDDGRHMSWNSPKMGIGSLTMTRVEAGKGMWYEGAIGGTAVNTRGSITYTEADGVVTVTWHDMGDLPPVIGGYFAAMTSQAYEKQYTQSLDKLKARLES